MKTVSLKLPDDLDSRLEATARRKGASKSEVVRRALVKFLPLQQGAPGSSFSEQAGSFIGCLEGPRDLSSNPRHLRGYGR